MGTYTTRKNLYKPADDETGWGTLVNANFNELDKTRIIKGADVPSEAALFTTSGFPTDGNYFDITGSVGITSIITSGSIGTVICLHFDSALTITHHATDLMLSAGIDTKVNAGDELMFIEYESGKWRNITNSAVGKHRYAVVNLSTADVGALATGAGKELISAPGANELIEVTSCTLVLNYAGAAFTEVSPPDDLALNYDGVTGTEIWTADTTGFITSAADAMLVIHLSTLGSGAAAILLATNANKNVALINKGNNYGAGGTSTITAHLVYTIYDVS